MPFIQATPFSPIHAVSKPAPNGYGIAAKRPVARINPLRQDLRQHLKGKSFLSSGALERKFLAQPQTSVCLLNKLQYLAQMPLSEEDAEAVLQSTLSKEAAIFSAYAKEIGGIGILADHGAVNCLGDPKRYPVEAGKAALSTHEIALSPLKFSVWLKHWLGLSCLNSTLGSASYSFEHQGLRRHMLNSITSDYNVTPTMRKAAQILDQLAAQKLTLAQGIIVSHFRHEPRIIDDKNLLKLIHHKNLQHTPVIMSLIKALEECLAYAPVTQMLSDTFFDYFNCQATRKNLLDGVLELPYQLKYAIKQEHPTKPTPERAAFYQWSNQALRSNVTFTEPVQQLIELTQTQGLLEFRGGQLRGRVSKEFWCTWDSATSVTTQGQTPGFSCLNTMDPMEHFKISRYTQSCMNVFRDQDSAQYHLGRFLNPLNRQLQIFEGQAFVCRAMIRVMFDWDDTLYLYLDKAYFSDESNTARNRTGLLELIHGAQMIGQTLTTPVIIEDSTLNRLDPEVWRVVGRQTLQDLPLLYPDYYDGEINQANRPLRGRLHEGEIPRVAGFQNPFERFDIDPSFML